MATQEDELGKVDTAGSLAASLKPQKFAPFGEGRSTVGKILTPVGNTLAAGMDYGLTPINDIVGGTMQAAGRAGAEVSRWFQDSKTDPTGMSPQDVDAELARRRGLTTGAGALSPDAVRESLGGAAPTKPPAPTPEPPFDASQGRTVETFEQSVGLAPQATYEETVGLPRKQRPEDKPLWMANYPDNESISNLGNYADATDLAARSAKAVGIGASSDYAAADPGRVRLTNAAQGQESSQSVVADPSKQIGGSVAADGTTTQNYETNYTIFGKNGQQGTASITGPDKRVGGGTVSVMDQGNGGTVEGNVAAINRQTAALTSLREAQNPGITTGTGAYAPRQESAAPVDPFARPGDGIGDSQARASQYENLLREAAGERGIGGSKRAAAKVAAANALMAPGLKLAELGQEGQRSKDSLAAQVAQNQAASADRRFGVESASEDRRYATDASLAGNRLKAERDAERLKIDAEDMATRRYSALAGRPGVEREYLATMDQRAKATDPAQIQRLDEKLKALKEFKRAPDDPYADFATPPPKAAGAGR